MSADETALFALGSFWEAEDFFMQLPGVTSTEVGYTGGTSSHPTFHDLGDHSETVHITFDPRQISYEELLQSFWKLHDPTADQESQYRSVIFYVDEHQHRTAEASRAGEQLQYKLPILTLIEPVGKFHRAETYHQQYFAKLRA